MSIERDKTRKKFLSSLVAINKMHRSTLAERRADDTNGSSTQVKNQRGTGKEMQSGIPPPFDLIKLINVGLNGKYGDHIRYCLKKRDVRSLMCILSIISSVPVYYQLPEDGHKHQEFDKKEEIKMKTNEKLAIENCYEAVLKEDTGKEEKSDEDEKSISVTSETDMTVHHLGSQPFTVEERHGAPEISRDESLPLYKMHKYFGYYGQEFSWSGKGWRKDVIGVDMSTPNKAQLENAYRTVLKALCSSVDPLMFGKDASNFINQDVKKLWISVELEGFCENMRRLLMCLKSELRRVDLSFKSKKSNDEKIRNLKAMKSSAEKKYEGLRKELESLKMESLEREKEYRKQVRQIEQEIIEESKKINDDIKLEINLRHQRMELSLKHPANMMNKANEKIAKVQNQVNFHIKNLIEERKSVFLKKDMLESQVLSVLQNYEAETDSLSKRVEEIDKEIGRKEVKIAGLSEINMEVDKRYQEMKASQRLREILKNVELMESQRKTWAARKIQNAWKRFKTTQLKTKRGKKRVIKKKGKK